MIIITVTKENRPVDHFLYWFFEKKKAIQKLSDLCKNYLGFPVDLNSITEDELSSLHIPCPEHTISWVEKEGGER